MGGESSPAILADLATLFGAGSVAGLSDGALLDRFLEGPADRAEAAFAALLERHGPMVLRVGRQVLVDPHDAEDVAQATFLVLARRARAIRRSDSLASWLHGVACRVAARTRADALRRRARERRGAELAAQRADRPEDDPARSWPELHEELGRLPEKFRQAIVLCHLEGLSHEQAAQAIGCPVRTVQSRLARGRLRLKDRLVRRGVGPAAAVLASTLAPDARAFGPGPTDAWKHTTVQAATRVAAGGSATALVSNPVAALVEGVLIAMKIDSLKSAALWLGLAACTLGILARAALRAAEPPADPRYGVTMSDGTKVELVGVSTHPSGPTTWWRGDGSPLAEAPADPSPSGLDLPGHAIRAVVVRVSGLPEGATLKWLPSYDGSYTGDRPTRGGKPEAGLERYIAAFREDRATCSLEVRVASGPWRTEAVDRGVGGHAFVQEGHKFYFGKARGFAGGTAIAVAHDIVGSDNRFVAVDLEGKVHAPVYSSGGGGPILSLLDVEFSVPPERIREYQVQARPFERAEIRDVALWPKAGAEAAGRGKPAAPAVKEHRAITLSRAYWADEPGAPEMVKQALGSRLRDGAGHALVHGEEWFDDQPYQQYKRFMQAAGKGFVLKADGHPDLRAEITQGYFTDPSRALREMELRIPPADYARMEPGVDYVLEPRNENEDAGYSWRLKGRVTLRRP